MLGKEMVAFGACDKQWTEASLGILQSDYV